MSPCLFIEVGILSIQVLNIAFGENLHDWVIAVITSYRSKACFWADYPHFRKGKPQHITDLRSIKVSWLWVAVSGTFNQFPGVAPWLTVTQRISRFICKKTAGHGGILEPASSAGAQHFFTHTTSNNDRFSCCQALPDPQLGGIWCYLTSKGHPQLHGAGTRSHGKKFSRFSLSAFLLYSFGHFSLCPAPIQQDESDTLQDASYKGTPKWLSSLFAYLSKPSAIPEPLKQLWP